MAIHPSRQASLSNTLSRGNEIVLRSRSRPTVLIRLRSPAHPRAPFACCQTRSLACSHPLTSFFKIEKAVINTAFSILVVGATRFEHATSWSQTKRSTRLSYAPSTDLVITTYFSILQAFFYYFLIFGKIKPELRKLKISFLVTIKWS